MRVYTGTEAEDFFYIKNMQGDITGLIDSAGNPVVSYRYDSLGKQTCVFYKIGYIEPLYKPSCPRMKNASYFYQNISY